MRELQKPIQFVRGVGPNLAKRFSAKGIDTIENALNFYPLRYEDRRNIKKIANLNPGAKHVVMGEVLVSGESGYRKKAFEAIIGDGTGMLTAKWFHYKTIYMQKIFKKGRKVVFYGEVKFFGGKRMLIHPEVEIIDSGNEGEPDSLNFNRIVPIYSAIDGVYPKVLRRIMERIAQEYLDFIPEPFSEERLKRFNLIYLREAFRKIHFPDDSDDVDKLNRYESPAHRRLVFDELFFLEVGLAYKKKLYEKEKGIMIIPDDSINEKFRNMLPFRLTSAQERVVMEIKADLSRSYPMHRLLQGDVGSGKTVVAFVAALTCIGGGFQVALMAPTEILAEQHFLRYRNWLNTLDIRSALLTGDVPKSEKTKLLEEIEDGSIKMVIGTHALIQESVRFKNLGLCIVDEQHRFGVMQRSLLQKKGGQPHVLVMTATPIPRTLSMTLYGDLDLSVIDEMPPGRKPVLTRVVNGKDRLSVYNRIREAMNKGEQAYIVYPLIEESEKLELRAAKQMFQEFREKIFPDIKIGLLHGRMKSQEKEDVMSKFRDGSIHVLVSTTVIEVGIDIPNATLMVVEHAERFGLSQLHQLRGRVKRSDSPAECILVAYRRPTEDAYRRLKIMKETDDGFRIAEEDLKIRGPGDLIGTRQWGMPDFRVANLMRDAKILSDARNEAFSAIESDPELTKPENQILKTILSLYWKNNLELARVG
ncbi:MAG TPA: ATP-dependent DNA helicase RecG [bacterium]